MDRKWLSFMVVLIVYVGSLAFYQISSIPLPFLYEQAEVVPKDNPLDGCYHVYLDVGTNIGIQVTTFIKGHQGPKIRCRKYYAENM